MDTNNSEQASQRTLSAAADSVSALAERVQQTVRQTQDRLSELQRDLKDKTRYAAQTTDTYVHENPWNAVGIAAGVGFVIGLIVGRR